jgi:hypothetical protein
MFIPDDPRLRTFAFGIAEQRRHSLRKPDAKDDLELGRDTEAEREIDPEDQLSLFSAIAAVPLDEEGRPLEASSVYEDPDSDEMEGGAEEIPGLATDDAGSMSDSRSFALVAEELEAELPTPEPATDGEAGVSPRSRKRKLRESNSARVRSLVHRTRLSHAKVNAELNRKVGIERVTEATLAQLEKRLAVADQWLQRLR